MSLSQFHGFFVEYDRGTMGARGYLEKLGAYADYLESGRFTRDYVGFPTILVVAADNAVEERIASAACRAAIGRTVTLPILLSTPWRILDPRNPFRLLGPIWREPAR